jgi:hypothetical protein
MRSSNKPFYRLLQKGCRNCVKHDKARIFGPRFYAAIPKFFGIGKQSAAILNSSGILQPTWKAS